MPEVGGVDPRMRTRRSLRRRSVSGIGTLSVDVAVPAVTSEASVAPCRVGSESGIGNGAAWV